MVLPRLSSKTWDNPRHRLAWAFHSFGLGGPKTVVIDDHRIDRQTIPASDRCYPARPGRFLESLGITGAIARRISSGT